jgi:hypothetical protein
MFPLEIFTLVKKNRATKPLVAMRRRRQSRRGRQERALEIGLHNKYIRGWINRYERLEIGLAQHARYASVGSQKGVTQRGREARHHTCTSNLFPSMRCSLILCPSVILTRMGTRNFSPKSKRREAGKSFTHAFEAGAYE